LTRLLLERGVELRGLYRVGSARHIGVDMGGEFFARIADWFEDKRKNAIARLRIAQNFHHLAVEAIEHGRGRLRQRNEAEP
jgi:hypothetical protein